MPKVDIVEPYYEADIINLEKLLRKAAQNRPLDAELASLVSEGVELNRLQGLELKSLQRRYSALEHELSELKTRKQSGLLAFIKGFSIK